MDITEVLRQFREQDKGLALILDTFTNIDRVHRETLRAMGCTSEAVPTVKSSAKVRLSADTAVSTTNRSFGS